jgi:hypothetical protein
VAGDQELESGTLTPRWRQGDRKGDATEVSALVNELSRESRERRIARH